MSLFVKYQYFVVTVVLSLMPLTDIFGQPALVYNEGSITNLAVKQIPENQYRWEIYTDFNNKIKATAVEINFTAGQNSATTSIEWRKAGDYFFSITVFNADGCKNIKLGKLKVVATSSEDNHFIIATPDYARTTWIDAIDIRVLNNDFDTENDIDTTSLKVTQKPTLGGVVVKPDGSIIYTPIVSKSGRDQFVYSICDSAARCDTALVTIDLTDGPIWIPEAISPNDDGDNDIFIIKGLESYQNTEITIYTRAGQLVYQSSNYQNNWDGRALNCRIEDGTLLPTGTYYYVLHLGGTNRYLKGFIYLAY